jgi:hypothetical protein
MHHTEVQPGALVAGSVVLDIGGDIGAALISMPDETTGMEVEIRRTDDPWDGTHTGIRPSGPLGSFAVFGRLRAGDYEIRVKGSTDPVLALQIVGSEVSQLTWRSVSGPTGDATTNRPLAP